MLNASGDDVPVVAASFFVSGALCDSANLTRIGPVIGGILILITAKIVSLQITSDF